MGKKNDKSDKKDRKDDPTKDIFKPGSPINTTIFGS
jgi:hypothetical protein